MLMVRDEAEDKRIEMIGLKFREQYPESYALFEQEFQVDSPYLVALEVSEYLPDTYERLKKEIKDDFDEWKEQLDAESFAMTEGDYLRREI